jgi:hypothetical protein
LGVGLPVASVPVEVGERVAELDVVGLVVGFVVVGVEEKSLFAQVAGIVASKAYGCEQCKTESSCGHDTSS